MMNNISIALIGDFNEQVTAHRAIPISIQLAADSIGIQHSAEWVGTESIEVDKIRNYNGVWVVPASPYVDMERALLAIQYCREENVPFLGTCGGYQHAALEFARNVLGLKDADNGEVNPDAELKIVSALTCALVEQSDSIQFDRNSIIAKIYQVDEVNEKYHCSFGVNPAYLPLFDESDMQFTGKDSSNDPRVLEIPSHKFFIGTAYQPERSALEGAVHPLIVEFLKAAAEN